jgi:hypothetical protein
VNIKGNTMNRSLTTAFVVAAAFAAAAASPAFAETPELDSVFVGSKTRAEVQADLAAYKAAGVNPWSTQYNPLKTFKSTQSRDSVVAEYIASRDQVAALTGEDSGSAFLAQAASKRVLDTHLAAK